MGRVIICFLLLLYEVCLFGQTPVNPYAESRRIGINAYNEGKYEYALKCFQSVLKIAPANNDLAEWIEKCKVKVKGSSNATSRPFSKISDSYYIEQAKKYFLLEDIPKAEQYLARVDNRKSVDYCLLKGDISYLYNVGENDWRSYYNCAAYLGNNEAKEKAHSIIVEQVICTHTSHPNTEAEILAYKADSLIQKSWNDKTREECFNLYLKSAEMGHPIAQMNIGRFYLHGYGTKRNFQEAFTWFTKVANSNSSVQNDARCILAWFYFNGICIAKDEAKTYELVKDQTYGYSGTNNGLCNEFGIGTNVDKQKALYLYRNIINNKPSYSSQYYDVAMERYCHLTCTEGINDTINMDGKLCNDIAVGMSNFSKWAYLTKGEKEQYAKTAAKLRVLAYEKGVEDTPSKMSLGYYFKENKDYNKAFVLFQSASDEDKYASFNIGELYENGLGVERDYIKAKEWYIKAEEMGHYQAGDAIKRLKKKGY